MAFGCCACQASQNITHQVSGFSDVYVSFGIPVNNLSFNVLNVCHCFIPFGQVSVYVYTNQQFYGSYTVYFQHGGTNAMTFLQSIPNITDTDCIPLKLQSERTVHAALLR